jgi:hypothetical protein
MTAMTIFYQECPVCGRSLRIPAKYFGRQMTCTHCHGEFRAGKEEIAPPTRMADAELSGGVIEARTFAQSELREV